ncbi:hypothetical protein Glove_139g18 [Diversispora epigaea]|uniref:Uncharacterized protein n=1 Tax=Diversispora epigaea TaxID=1348612 RepID=A0A397IYI8_9GLOM|nr:hypothetical protein Glove_139g18 [Diversispora epigaea]
MLENKNEAVGDIPHLYMKKLLENYLYTQEQLMIAINKEIGDCSKDNNVDLENIEITSGYMRRNVEVLGPEIFF